MNRYQFLQEFLDALGPLSEEEKQQISDYYEELICDGLEQGLSEEEVLARFGSPQDEARRFRDVYKRQLFALEDRYGLTVHEENGICLRVDCSKSEDAELLSELLTAWRQAASMRERGLLSAEDYDHWRYRFPTFSPPRRPERSSPESASSLVEQYKKTEP